MRKAASQNTWRQTFMTSEWPPRTNGYLEPSVAHSGIQADDRTSAATIVANIIPRFSDEGIEDDTFTFPNPSAKRSIMSPKTFRLPTLQHLWVGNSQGRHFSHSQKIPDQEGGLPKRWQTVETNRTAIEEEKIKFTNKCTRPQTFQQTPYQTRLPRHEIPSNTDAESRTTTPRQREFGTVQQSKNNIVIVSETRHQRFQGNMSKTGISAAQSSKTRFHKPNETETQDWETLRIYRHKHKHKININTTNINTNININTKHGLIWNSLAYTRHKPNKEQAIIMWPPHLHVHMKSVTKSDYDGRVHQQDAFLNEMKPNARYPRPTQWCV